MVRGRPEFRGTQENSQFLSSSAADRVPEKSGGKFRESLLHRQNIMESCLTYFPKSNKRASAKTTRISSSGGLASIILGKLFMPSWHLISDWFHDFFVFHLPRLATNPITIILQKGTQCKVKQYGLYNKNLQWAVLCTRKMWRVHITSIMKMAE